MALVTFKLIPETQGKLQYVTLAGVCAVISVLALYWCVFGTRQRALAFETQRLRALALRTIPIGQQLKIALSNRPFMFVIGVYLFSC